MDQFIHEQNLLLFRKRLAETADLTKRQMLLRLIADENAKWLKRFVQTRKMMPTQSSAAFLGALALSLCFGAIQIASGSDLGSVRGNASQTVNRTSKSDRTPLTIRTMGPAQTLSFYPQGKPVTSVLVRILSIRSQAQVVDDLFSPAITNSSSTKSDGKATCEATVSVLTDVAKHLKWAGHCFA